MEYKYSLPEKNDNVSHDKPLREFVLLFCGITFFLLSGFWIIGLFVDQAVGYISPAIEATIFSSVGSVMEPDEEDDPQQAELQRLLDKLMECSNVSYPVQVYLSDSNKANAMAVPGGRIIVLKGLLDKVSSENGLSFILAHELAHFQNRDHLRGMGRSIVFTAAAAMLTGAGSDITQIFTPTLNLSFSQYSQTRESLADQTALKTLNCQYGHVGGAAEFFESMKPVVETNYHTLNHYFASHPESIERINDLWQEAKTLNFTVREVTPLPPLLAGASP